MGIELHTFAEKWAFLKEKEVFLACSGGVDSMVLADLLLKLKIRFTFLHVNYHLRGEESNEDEHFVRQFAQENGLPIFVHSVNLAEELKAKKGNLQQRAREIRYAFFAQFLSNPDALVLLAHHFDDQLETFYMQLFRKSGIDGLSCMAEVDTQKLRPLLIYRKSEIYQYAKENELTWREDSSNQKNKYQRNKWRNIILPKLEAEIPDLATSVACLIAAFQSTKVEEEKKSSLLLKEKQIEVAVWRTLSVKQRITVLKSKGFSSLVYKEVDKLLTSQKGKVILGKHVDIYKESELLVFKEKTESSRLLQFSTTYVDELPKQFTKEVLFLDADKIQGELKLRTWQKGDRIASIGLNGTQLVSDILKDAKVPSYQKAEVRVLVDDEVIHAVVGYKISRKSIATSTTKKIIKICVEMK